MFSFFKKSKSITVPKEPERYYVPEPSIHLLLDILDDIDSGRHIKTMRYRLWRNIADIFPTLDIENKRWALSCGNILKPYIYEIK